MGNVYREIAQILADYKDRPSFALSGAGLSAESGIPTFRGGKDGLWNKFNPTELATFEAFEEDPVRVWKWYLWRMRLIAKTAPNAGHIALVELERLLPDFWHVTQNVDGLHRVAGQKKYVELHGNIWEGHCRYCGQRYNEHEFPIVFPYADRNYLRKLSDEEFEREILQGLTKDKLPKCSVCGGIVGPGVVWFGEPLPEHALVKAFQLAQDSKVCFSVGTSAVVYPAAYVPEQCKRKGGILVEINPEETPLTPLADFSLRESAAKALPRIAEELKNILQKIGYNTDEGGEEQY